MTDWSSLVEYRCRLCRSNCINEAGAGCAALDLCRDCFGQIPAVGESPVEAPFADPSLTGTGQAVRQPVADD